MIHQSRSLLWRQDMRLNHRYLGMLLSALAQGTAFGAPAPQVETVQPPSPMADALAAQMRVLGADPKNVPALIEAGELALKLGDATAAARFFGRAERLDPGNARLKAGEASALVHLERPGEALRLFAQAQALGADPATFAAEQALAFDLVGQQARAQRAYRLALMAGHDDETERRYALSLGISGQREAALEQIDAQLRRSDRAAWRVRAFVLAMTGDVAGANRIAAATLPTQMASGLQPFFEILGGLGPVDRAFAVHFGEVSPTAERVADARLAPVFAPLAPERVAIAQAAAPAPVAQTKRPPDKRRSRAEPPPVAVALGSAPQRQTASLVVPAPPRPPAAPPGFTSDRPGLDPAPAKIVAGAQSGKSVSGGTASPGGSLATLASNGVASAPVVLAGAGPSASLLSTPTPARAVPSAEVQATPAQPPAQNLAVTKVAPPATVAGLASPLAPGAGGSVADGQKAVSLRAGAPVASAAAPKPADGPAAASGVAAESAPVVVAQLPAQPDEEAGDQTEALNQSPASPPVQAASAAPDSKTAPITEAGPAESGPPPLPRPQPTAVASEESILARIIAGIGVPASELGVGPARAATPAPEREPALKNAAKAVSAPALQASPPVVADRADSARRLVADKAAADRKLADRKLADKKLTDAKLAADKKLADKALADKKAADKKAAEKIAAEKKTADDKAAKANPSRVWVQVSGGANVRDLPKAWASVRDRAPALKGKAAWSTPLRFTNRVLTGPFASQAEAQNFVNLLAKSGVSGFVFTSDKGQPVSRVAAP